MQLLRRLTRMVGGALKRKLPRMGSDDGTRKPAAAFIYQDRKLHENFIEKGHHEIMVPLQKLLAIVSCMKHPSPKKLLQPMLKNLNSFSMITLKKKKIYLPRTKNKLIPRDSELNNNMLLVVTSKLLHGRDDILRYM
ncbi:hypothetical protein OIU84_009602 [Salix udensis]|uniref:Uncharacterized protein n=1 Tax=Salix udensis TaxID=889485 RepID=A0AAD6JRT7_9ROSI|nr:hypothetical protein OIU84_009602 [Salix udensis]